jgi:hypothetical protein
MAGVKAERQKQKQRLRLRAGEEDIQVKKNETPKKNTKRARCN